jgi:hypothetical protein
MNATISQPLRVLILLCALAVPLDLAAQERTNGPTHHHYKLIDLGTFGGPLSGINEPLNYVPAVNRRGQTVGFSANSVPQTVLNNPTACFGTNVTHAFEWMNSAVTDLGSLAGPAQEFSRIRGLLMNRHRGFMPRTITSVSQKIESGVLKAPCFAHVCFAW